MGGYGQFYLLDNPPASNQFYASRNNGGLTGGIIVHSSEGSSKPGSAQALAGFISRRSDPGSYSCIVDSGGEVVFMVPDDYTTFSVAASGYNSRTWSICLCGTAVEFSTSDPATMTMIGLAADAIVGFCRRNGFDAGALQWNGTGTLVGPGLACHGDVQPWDRTDAWTTNPNRFSLDSALLAAIQQRINPQSGDETLKAIILIDPRDRKAWHCFGNTKFHIKTMDSLNLLRFFKTPEVNPAPIAWIDALATLP